MTILVFEVKNLGLTNQGEQVEITCLNTKSRRTTFLNDEEWQGLYPQIGDAITRMFYVPDGNCGAELVCYSKKNTTMWAIKRD